MLPNEKNLIGYEYSAKGSETIFATNPETLKRLPGDFALATDEELELTMQKAHEAWKVYRGTNGVERGAFLRAIADEIELLGNALIQRAMEESGLPEARLAGERGRTCNQLRAFAAQVEEGSWVEASIDTAIPDRSPVPKPDIRKMNLAIGPVVVFTASNFPLAFSTAGGDTASALAAGCPVIVKAHESHLGTNAMVAEAIMKAAKKCKMPDGVFSSLFGLGYGLGAKLVEHPLTQAVAFTGSFRGGKNLFDIANRREKPIPVFAEMGSINPMFLLPSMLKHKAETTANIIAASVTLGAGQFCTNPGVVVVPDDEYTTPFLDFLKTGFASIQAATMLNKGIFDSYLMEKTKNLGEKGVALEFEDKGEQKGLKARATVASVRAVEFIANPNLHREVFGPFTLLVKCKGSEEMLAAANALEGQLTASVFGSDDELLKNKSLIITLQEKVGRLIFNSVPTGVEVCPSMHHGGPFPATTDSRYTSVGISAIKRFVRPVAYQDCPAALLPDALQDGNPLGILRMVNGVFTAFKES